MKYDSNFKKFKREYDEAIINSLEEVGAFGTAEGQLRTPVKTGQLRRSLKYKTDKDLRKVTIGTNIDYAEKVHDGGSNRKAQPFLKDAIYQNISFIEAIFKKHHAKVGE